MNSAKPLISALLCIALFSPNAELLAEEAAIPAKWQIQEIHYAYAAFTAAYDCDAAASKVKAILKTLGAHPDTKVRASGCASDLPERDFFMTITTATPIAAREAQAASADKSRQDLLKRLGAKTDIANQEFPATWIEVDLSKQRNLDLHAGDCELIEGLRDFVLPKLQVMVERQRISCKPNQLNGQPPELRVRALVPVQSPDARGDSTSR